MPFVTKSWDHFTSFVTKGLVTSDGLDRLRKGNEHRRRRITAFSLGLLLADDERAGKRGKTRQWIKRRQEKGFFANIVQELMVEGVAGYREMFRMKPADSKWT